MPLMPADTPPEPPAQMPASSWDIQAPYDPGAAGHINVHGDADPGGGDRTSGTVAGAVAESDARLAELESDTSGQGSVIGDLMSLPAVTGGAFYDPPRDYGG